MKILSITKDQHGAIPNTVLIIAFNPTNGRVHGTFAHGSYGEDEAGVARSRKRFLAELRNSLGAEAKIDAIELRHDQMPEGSIKFVDPKTRRLVMEELERNLKLKAITPRRSPKRK
jgi:hypothetical protein